MYDYNQISKKRKLKMVFYLALLLLVFSVTLSSVAYYKNYVSDSKRQDIVLGDKLEKPNDIDSKPGSTEDTANNSDKILPNTGDYEISTDKLPKPLDKPSDKIEGLLIDLKEPNWDNMIERLNGKKLYLKPGATYPKDPTVSLKGKSANAFVFMAFEHNLISKKDGSSLIQDILINEQAWKDITPKDSNKKVYIYVGPKSTTDNYLPSNLESTELEPLFSKVKALSNFDKSDLSKKVDYNIKVEAYAHQATENGYSNNVMNPYTLIEIAINSALIKFGIEH